VCDLLPTGSSGRDSLRPPPNIPSQRTHCRSVSTKVIDHVKGTCKSIDELNMPSEPVLSDIRLVAEGWAAAVARFNSDHEHNPCLTFAATSRNSAWIESPHWCASGVACRPIERNCALVKSGKIDYPEAEMDLLILLILLLVLFGGGGGLYWGMGVGWGIGPIGLILAALVIAYLVYGYRGRRNSRL
jgi:hypothetical protein